MAQQTENLDFSGLFKLDVLIHLDIVTYSFYEVGHKKFFVFSSDKELFFIYVNPQSERFEKNYDWDFLDNPIYCVCFEPSGTWVLIISEQKVLLVPFLPLFIPQSTFDHKWSLSRVTVLPLGSISRPTAVVCWLTKESENVIIIGSKTGSVTFYSLESQSIVGECKVVGEITDLQICFDDSLDLLALLITSSKSQQWKLVLEHRSFGYNWLQQTRAQNDRDKKDSFMSYIRQLSKDKITFFIQGGSKDDNKSQTVEYVLKPTEYLPVYRKGSNNWALTAQYVNGRHFLTAFELNEGTLILEGPEEDAPSRTLRPNIKKDGLYLQGLWSQRLIYLVRKNELEIHSTNFSIIQSEALLGGSKDYSEIWSAELIGDVRRAHLMSAKEPPAPAGGWREPTFLCDLQLPRFSLEPCLVVTTCGAYILNTVADPCEWLVGMIMRGGAGAEQCAARVGAPVPQLLRAAADMLMSRGCKIPAAQYLYTLSQSQPDGWLARLGVFGRLQELSLYKQTNNIGSLGNAAITIKLLAVLLKMATNDEEKFDTDLKFTALSPTELLELSSFTVAVGLWDLVPVFNVCRGFSHLLLTAIKSRNDMCRGAMNCLLKQRCLVPLLLEENGQWLFDYITGNCDKFDMLVLKRLCLWLNPMQDQLRPVMRDMKQSITSVFTTRMLNLISTFIQIACEIENREPCSDIHTEIAQEPDTWKTSFAPRRALSCGLAHWAVVDDGNAKIMMVNTPVNTELIGRVIDVACGRHHTLVLTENGVYSAGDNSFGQLGVGRAWKAGAGEAAKAGGALLHVPHKWAAPLKVLAAGHYHSAALDHAGRLYMWGWGVHGQLGLGNIDDQWTPRLVTKFQGRKVLSVGCGACHTVMLMLNGEVFGCGAGVFGQLGSGGREKSSLPIRILLPDPIETIAVGYFHTLALSNRCQVWWWGASPQQIRAGAARRAHDSPADAAPAPPPPAHDTHLAPQLLDTADVSGRVVQLAAGWHHSFLLNNMGIIYSWGLNFDGQLEVKIRTDTQPDTVKNSSSKTPEVETKELKTKALIACGGDFTIYIDDDGRIYTTGNSHIETNNEKEKGTNRIIMMKTTKRVIKIPANRNNNKFLFQPIDRIDIMFPFDIGDLERKPIEPRSNPLTSMEDFQKQSWADEVILRLKPWINEDNLASNHNMAAKLAYHNGMYSECLRLLLQSLKSEPCIENVYFSHTILANPESGKDRKSSMNKDDMKIMISNIMSKRIKEISLSILNDESYPATIPTTYQSLPCCCDESKYLTKGSEISILATTNIDISVKAAEIIDKCVSNFPIDSELWESCFRQSKNFYLENGLLMVELEKVLRKYMESHATTMAAAIMCSNDCVQYSEVLSPNFYLNMCSQVLDTWG
ncbi:hypothetical protein K1T71_004409 [Dendrolimus kikuchii]|uniref:Uncharacterized protein n=1 Tax=Dendrolimus kikuchii TaxID=765133 RepID=A0ACC1D890_9NEOP|nr:hypothetical protein K1T71_004409 [Dendrolimus kikuchii]